MELEELGEPGWARDGDVGVDQDVIDLLDDEADWVDAYEV